MQQVLLTLPLYKASGNWGELRVEHRDGEVLVLVDPEDGECECVFSFINEYAEEVQGEPY